jgi:hypothetical protein
MTQTDELTGFPVPVHRANVSGVPVFSSPADGPVTATLSFRVGRIDERLTTSGITHLVEHLAIPSFADRSLDRSGRVEYVRTVFLAHGEPDEVAGFFASVCAGLDALPLERFETERRILESEATSAGGANVYAVLAGQRFGARGVGLVNWDEHGFDCIPPGDAAAWAAERFTAASAVAWTTGDPDDLRLSLPEGSSSFVPPPLERNEFRAPGYFEWGSGGIAFSALVPRTAASLAAVDLLQDRLLQVLRFELGISYTVVANYEPLTADLAYVVFGADSPSEPRSRRARPDHLHGRLVRTGRSLRGSARGASRSRSQRPARLDRRTTLARASRVRPPPGRTARVG